MSQQRPQTSPFGARPKKRRRPPRGWRLLAVGERVRAGDKVYFRSRWETVLPQDVGRVVHPWSFLRARQIAPGSPAAGGGAS